MKNEEITLEKGHSVAATIAFFSEVIRFIIIPLVLLDVIMSYYPLLTHDTASWLASHLLVIGIFVALFVAMETYFPKGSYLKLIFGILAVVTLCVWFWFLLQTGTIGFPMGSIFISINVVGLATVILIAVALKGLLPVGQFIIARKDLQEKRDAAAAAASAESAVEPSPAPVPSVIPGQTSKDEPPPPDDFKAVCPVCKSRIPANVDVCPKCGAWIRQKRAL